MLVLQCMHVEVLNYEDVRIFCEKTPRKTPELGGESPPKTPENGIKIKSGNPVLDDACSTCCWYEYWLRKSLKDDSGDSGMDEVTEVTSQWSSDKLTDCS